MSIYSKYLCWSLCSVNPFSTETVLLVDYWSYITYTLLYT